jgi:glycosyltransferase involved in cell wall biosynthesis
MRVALIRGSLLRAWELPNYDLEDAQVEVLASRRAAAPLPGARPAVRAVPTAADALARLGPRGRAIVDYFAGSLEYVFGLEAALRGVDVAHALELANPFTLQAIRAREAGACRRVVATVMENIAFPRPANRRVAARAAAVAQGVDHFLAVTGPARLHLLAAGVPDSRITVLPLGTDVERFRPAATRESAGGPLRVLTVARLELAKGVEDLVVAIGLLAERGVDATATFVGEGPLRGRLEAIASALGVADRVTLRDGVAWEHLDEVYREHDAFVLASAPTSNWREQFGFAVVEAMASGLPVAVGASGSLPAVVGDEGSLVRPHDPESLAARLEELAADDRRRRREGERNRSWAVERYDQRLVRRRLRTVYEEVLAD